MPSGKLAFKQSDAARLVRAAIRGGMPADRLRVVHDPVTKTISVEVRSESAPASEGELEAWMSKHAG
jgi:hypothetical protein